MEIICLLGLLIGFIAIRTTVNKQLDFEQKCIECEVKLFHMECDNFIKYMESKKANAKNLLLEDKRKANAKNLLLEDKRNKNN